MTDPRNARLAEIIVSHSLRVEPGEVVLIEAIDLADGLPSDLVDAVHRAGGIPLLYLRSQALLRQLLVRGDEREVALRAEVELFQLQRSKAYVAIRAPENVSEHADVPADKLALNGRLLQKPVHSDYRVNHTKWLILRYPTPSMAQLAGMSTSAFKDLYYRVCTLDYGRMADAIAPLAERMRATHEVRIVGPGTDLRFSLEGLDSDEGARYVGEFSLAFNPYLLSPIKDVLFDEKISGSLHFTPGQAYARADNGNRSQIHWDLVLIQRPEYGGGEVWFDGELIRKDGRFVVPELLALNPERLIAASP